jgi:cyclophilin family peptidyl-prolyl cis-trans isomerase
LENDRRWAAIPDDKNRNIAVKKGYLAFAGNGVNSRTTQMWIAFQDSSTLGHAAWETPFGYVSQSTLPNVDKIYTGYGDMPERRYRAVGYRAVGRLARITPTACDGT